MDDIFGGRRPRLDSRADPTPKYLKICREITKAIESGRLRAGDSLPAQREIAEYFGVTLMTVRQALSLLVEQEQVRIEHGRGTFIADRAYRLPIYGHSGFIQEIAKTGRTLRSEILSAEMRPAPRGVRARMGLTGNTVFCITRLRWVDDDPLFYSMSLLHPDVARRLDLEGLAERSLYRALEEQAELVVDHAAESFRAGVLGSVEAAALHRPIGSPALIGSRLTYTSDGRPVVDDRVIMPGDGVILATDGHADSTGVVFRRPADDPFQSAITYEESS